MADVASWPFVARVALWQSIRCVGRLRWRSMVIRERRHITSTADVARELAAHLSFATNGGRIRSANHCVRTRHSQRASSQDSQRPVGAVRRLPAGRWRQARRDGAGPDHSLQGPVGQALADVQRSAMQQSDQVQQAAREQGRAIVQAAQAQADQIIAAAHARSAAMHEQAADLHRITTGLLRYLEQSSAAFHDAHTAYAHELHRVSGAPLPADSRPVAVRG
ncbi:nitric oxide synthase oxygenase [Micromonospora aurantiaca (nom. illeg.)]|uniref:nitric oxide synthase oxygenase n=1 Tax=Micromonospora aurantiaca (nom. illeg.) TaxID=47850 RepID=UPI003F4D13A2